MIQSKRARALRKLPLAMAIGLATLASQQVIAHGFVETPKSRSMMCNPDFGGGLNTGCGSVMYDAQSVEYGKAAATQHHTGSFCSDPFSVCGPQNGHIASGGIQTFNQLDEQTSTRWTKTTIKPGMNDFSWRYRAGHATGFHQFYITKKDWNPNKPLTRDSFELTPLLHQEGNSVVMPTNKTSTHKVNIPADRAGYHIVLAVWHVSDTYATFYQPIDVIIDNDGVPVSQWNQIGNVEAEALEIGDTVSTRVFTASGDQAARSTVLKIENVEQAKPNNWPFLLAEKVNKANAGYQMGLVDADDKIKPNYGTNGIFINAKSDVTQVMIQKDQPNKPGTLVLSGLAADYTLNNGAADLHFNAIALGGKYTVEATVFKAGGGIVTQQQGEVGQNTPHFSLALKDVTAGDYDLVVVAKPEKGELLQKTHSFKLKDAPVGGGYDFVFPEGLDTYKAGTKVLATDGNVYECKPHPFSGWCKNYSPANNAYEPGKGWAWDQAWIKK
jgi:N-acetylglucosamine-binding protein A